MSELLLNYLTLERIRVPLAADTKEGIIAEMAELLRDELHDAATIAEAIGAREELISTGIGHGVALPHCRLGELAKSRLAVGVTSVNVDWQSMDEQPVRLVFAIAGSAGNPAEVVILLGEISRLLHAPALREWLKGAENAHEVYDILRTHV
ncbi:MAG TPA: PTS sugar transporter subunit IIA [bacterium]|nr:PTS sugar transporter subunit IIA [bacterium]